MEMRGLAKTIRHAKAGHVPIGRVSHIHHERIAFPMTPGRVVPNPWRSGSPHGVRGGWGRAARAAAMRSILVRILLRRGQVVSPVAHTHRMRVTAVACVA